MNKVLFKLHGWLALACFIPLLVICLTGSVLVFKHEIDSLLMHDKVRVGAVAESRLGLDTLLDTLQTRYSNHEVVGWALFEDPGRADLVYLIKRGTDKWLYLLLDQYTGEILAEPQTTTHYLTDWLLDLHYAFLVGTPGLIITTVFSVVLLLLSLSGFWLYRKFWKAFFTLRWRARRIVFFSDLHKMAGIIAAPVFLLLAITGGYWNITHVLHELEEHGDGGEHHKVAGAMFNHTLSIQRMAGDTAERISGFVPRYISFPHEPEDNDIGFYGDVGAGNPLLSQYASVVRYHADSGQWLDKMDIRTAPLGYKLLDSFRRLHFGNFAGLFSRVFWCVVGLIPLLLSITGITVWAIRRDKRKAKKQKQKLAQIKAGNA